MADTLDNKKIDPHFVFDLLNAIHYLIGTKPELAQFVIIKLADSYRYYTYQSHKEVIPFDVEWQFANDFLELEKVIFSKKLSFRLKKEGDFSDILIPPLLLQPIIDNAIHYGLYHKPDKGHVNVLAKKSDNEIEIEVTDNGLGVQSSDLYSRSLETIMRRLKKHFSDVQLEIGNRAQGGARTALSFKCR